MCSYLQRRRSMFHCSYMGYADKDRLIMDSEKQTKKQILVRFPLYKERHKKVKIISAWYNFCMYNFCMPNVLQIE